MTDLRRTTTPPAKKAAVKKKKEPVAPEVVPLETDADGQCVPGYKPAGFHPTRGPMMVKRSEGS